MELRYKDMPKENDEFIAICDDMMREGKFKLVTSFISKRELYEEKYFKIFEKWLWEYVNNWEKCDLLCYRVLNPMVEKFPELFEKVQEWTTHNEIFTKRAAAVCLLKASGTFYVHVPFEKVKTICDLLKAEKYVHVQKGIGWLLKYAYLAYPDETEQYLRDNLHKLSRTTFRYALEKMEENKRAYYMSL